MKIFESAPHGWVTIDSCGYAYMKLIDDPILGTGFFAIHRIRMVRKLGRSLLTDEHVHHKNKITFDNRDENLELLSASEHAKHHSVGRKHTEQSKMLMSSQRKGRKWPDEVREKIAAANRARAKPLTEEIKEKIRQKQTGKKMSAESSLKKSLALKGKPKSPEHRQKLAEANRRRALKPENLYEPE